VNIGFLRAVATMLQPDRIAKLVKLFLGEFRHFYFRMLMLYFKSDCPVFTHRTLMPVFVSVIRLQKPKKLLSRKSAAGLLRKNVYILIWR